MDCGQMAIIRAENEMLRQETSYLRGQVEFWKKESVFWQTRYLTVLPAPALGPVTCDIETGRRE